MSKILLPMFVVVFAGAFVVELVRRNNPELADALEAKARRAARSMPRPRWPRVPWSARPGVAATGK
jgi:hypothetical protein